MARVKVTSVYFQGSRVVQSFQAFLFCWPTSVTSFEPVTCNIIRIAAAVLIGPDGRTLLVRKRGTQAFMQPGGKIDAGEQPVEALARELEEELALVIDPASATWLGHFTAPAVNEPGFEVQAELFLVHISQPVVATAEIEEVQWIDPQGDGGLVLAPLTRDLVLPFYRQTLQTRTV